MDKIKLFCLPYAGGSAMIYRSNSWGEYLDNKIELLPIELAGRGKRSNMNYYSNFEQAVDDIYNLIKNEISHSSYAVYGHSMGSLLAYELYYKIKNSACREPLHIFFSGGKPPHIKDSKKIHKLPLEKFKKEILKLGGTPKEIFEDRELFDFFIPLLRADYKIIEEYIYISKKNKIECGITLLMGKKDHFKKFIDQWDVHAKEKCNVCLFEGGHFFINKNTGEITDIINKTLLKIT